MIEVKPPLQVLIAEKLWSITEDAERKKAILHYLEIGYVGWIPIEIIRPFVLCSDNRKARGDDHAR